ncbi:MAG: hypothetical protein IKS13_03750 [Ruminococcus sp.]|nr:hypothetical protein [Ruminococcus sp.]
MAKNIPDEVIVAELLNSVSIRAAAKKLGLQEKTIYKRMKQPEFKKLYADARKEVVEQATARLQNFANQAVSCLALVMSKQEYAPQVRTNAADAILRYCLKFSEKADIADRIEALEKVLDPLSQSLEELATTQLESDDIS